LEAFNQTTGRKTHDFITDQPEEIPDQIRQNHRNRVYLYSFLSDHYLEPSDPHIISGILSFINSFPPGKEKTKQVYSVSWPFSLMLLSRLLAFWGLFLTYCYWLSYLFSKDSILKSLPKLFRQRVITIVITLCFLVIYIFYFPNETLWGIYLFTPFFAAGLAFNYLARKKEEIIFKKSGEEIFCYIKTGIYKVFLYVLLIYLAFSLGLLFHAGLSAYSSVGYALKTITGIFYLFFGLMFIVITRLNGIFLNGSWGINLLSLPVWAVIIAEFAYPGGILLIIDEFFSSIINNLRQLDLKIKFRLKASELIIFLIVSVIGVLAWKQILAEGYSLNMQDIWGLIYLFFCFIVLPVTAFGCAIRGKKADKIFKKTGEC
ncbi:MAG: hypothetical protein ACLFQV_06515, partial [Vulcanimicrobiota bacterium]